DLLVGERANLLTVDDKNAKRCIFLEQRDCEHGSQAIFRIERLKWFIAVGRLSCDIPNMNYLFGPDCSRNSGPTVNAVRARIQLSQRSNQFGRLIVSRDWAKQVAVSPLPRLYAAHEQFPPPGTAIFGPGAKRRDRARLAEGRQAYGRRHRDITLRGRW